MSWKQKVDEFYSLMKKRGYTVKVRESSVHPYSYEKLEHVVTKDDYYHVAVNEHMIIKAPLEYTVSFIENEFDLLKKVD